MTAATVDILASLIADIDAHDFKAGVGKCDSRRKSDVAQADYADSCGALGYECLQARPDIVDYHVRKSIGSRICFIT